MATRPSLSMFTRGLSGLSQASQDPSSPNVNSPAEQRADSKLGFLKAMRPLPTQHVWNVFFDRYAASCTLASVRSGIDQMANPYPHRETDNRKSRRSPTMARTTRPSSRSSTS